MGSGPLVLLLLFSPLVGSRAVLEAFSKPPKNVFFCGASETAQRVAQAALVASNIGPGAPKSMSGPSFSPPVGSFFGVAFCVTGGSDEIEILVHLP